MAALTRSLTVLCHGASKSGKSTFGVTTPAPRLLLDVEGGARFLPIVPVVWEPAREKPPVPDGSWDTAVVPTRDWGTVEKAYQWLASGEHPFRALTIDSVSEVQQRHIELVGHRAQMTQAQWGDTFRAVTGLIRDIRDLTMHPTNPLEAVVMTAMTRQIDGVYKPWMQGQTATILPYLLDVTAYLWVDQVPNDLSGELVETRKLLTRRTTQFEAGERVGGKLPMVIELRSIDGPVGGEGAVSRMLNLIFGSRSKGETEEPGMGPSESAGREPGLGPAVSADDARSPEEADSTTPETVDVPDEIENEREVSA